MGHLVLTNAQAVQLVTSLAVLFAAAHLLGALARRVGQPPVVGYLAAGVVLGPSGLGALWPSLATFLLPPNGRSHLLGAVIQLALLVLLIVLGAETDLPLVTRLGRPALGLIGGSILVPLVVGSAVAYPFGASLVSGHRLAGVVLVGGALGVSSLPVIAQLVTELGIARRDVGQLALAVATGNDIYGFLLLAIVGASVQSGGIGSIARPLGGLVALLVVFLAFGQRCVDFLLRKVREKGPNPTGSIAVAVGVGLGAAAAMQAVGVEAALGAFFAGIAIGRSRFHHGDTLVRLRSLSDAVFAPLYFSSAGLLVDLRTVDSWRRLAVLAALLAAAVTSKALGAALGARWAGLRRREVAALATVLNGRGAMQVIIATAGLRMGLLSSVAYTCILVVSMASSLLVAPTLRRLVGQWPGSEVEQSRLAYEERIDASTLIREQRLLAPDLPGTEVTLAASVLDRAWPPAAELTVLTSSPIADTGRLPGVERAVRRRAPSAEDPLVAVLDEARLGYGVIGIGLPEQTDRPPQLVAELLNRSPLPIVLVLPGSDGRQGGAAPRQVAVATTGTRAAMAAEELAASLALHHRARLHIVHVSRVRRVTPASGAGRMGEPGTADGVLADAAARARELGTRPKVARRHDDVPSVGLRRYVAEQQVDLLVVGTRLRRVAESPFFGHTVEDLLRSPLAITLAIVAYPDAVSQDLDQPYADRHAT